MTWTKTASHQYGDERRGDLALSIALSRAMRAKGISQRDLAEMTGIRKETISRILSGRRRPSAKTLMLITSALGVSAEEIIQDMNKN